jgi:hypothetical protein
MLAVHLGTALLAQPAAATSTQARRILDGCEVGGGGNDIHSIESHYHQDKNRIDVTLRLCAAAKPGAVYRLHLDFAAPFVEQARGCADPTDAVIARGPKGHQGKGRSEVRGNLVRFFVPLDDLGVASAAKVPVVLLWAESRSGGVVDRVPNRESGDGCDQPQARTETLAQTRAVNGDLVWITRGPPSNGQFPDGVDDANASCAVEAQSIGLSGSVVAWFSAQGRYPAQLLQASMGPLYTADGTKIAQDVADLANCTKGGGNACLLAPIDKDLNGQPIQPGTLTWTGTQPNGTAAGAPNCDDWLSGSPGASGNGGTVNGVDPGWTTGSTGACNQLRYLICPQVNE